MIFESITRLYLIRFDSLIILFKISATIANKSLSYAPLGYKNLRCCFFTWKEEALLFCRNFCVVRVLKKIKKIYIKIKIYFQQQHIKIIKNI
jgi:hypothetical protein